jgi:tetratricopeptide (TPR) repeat protein
MMDDLVVGRGLAGERGLAKTEVWATVLLALCLLPGGAGAAGAKAQPTSPVSVAETDRRCQKCHERIYHQYLGTYMARASGLAIDLATPGEFRHAGAEYAVFRQQDELFLRYEEKSRDSAASLAGSDRLDYFLGSGHLGTTYLYSRNGYLFESPIAYYNSLGGYAMKPGLEEETRMPPGLALNDSCLRCHMSEVRKPDGGTENHYRGLPFLHTGITCESCHGNSDRHVASGGKSGVVNPAALPAAERDSVCIVCHLEGDTRVERRGKSILDYKPGDDVRQYMAYFAFAEDADTSRAVSEIEQFQASRCKRMSGSSMSCMTCHDVHAPPAERERVGYYRSKCLSCHAGARFASEHHAENPDCTSCHMPKTGAANVAHVAWTDHRLRKIPEPAKERNAFGMDRAELVSILEQGSDSRDLGLGYYDMVTRGDKNRKAVAERLLTQADAASPGDVPVLLALGVLAQMDRRNVAAEKFYQQVLRVDPTNLTAATNLGPLLAAEGNVREAEELWSRIFQRNEDQAVLGRNLAIVQCMLGEREKAEDTLRRVLVYGPDQPALVETLRSIENGQRECSAVVGGK